MKNINLFAGILLCSLLLFGCIYLPFSPEEALSVGNTTSPANKAYSETQSKNYWSSTYPLSIIAWKYSGNSLELTFKNRDSSLITVTDMAIDGLLFYVSDNSFSLGESIAINASMLLECGNSGDSFSLEGVSITYKKGGVSGLEQRGAKPIVGTCS